MCIICYKPIGKNLPSKTKIKTMFRNNPDGAGFMYADGKHVYIVKGLMTLGEFNRELNKIRKNAQELPVVMHFRITTHGGTSKGMTHPFALTANVQELTATRNTTACGVAHNGMIPITSYAKKMSDTAEFISRYMVKLLDPQNVDVDVLDIIEEVIESKMCILTADKDVHLLGQFTTDGNGVFYSNDSYKSPRKYRAPSFTAPYYYGAGALYPDCNGGACYECAEELNCFGTFSAGNPNAFTTCADDCDLCKFEGDCLGHYSDNNPYNPRIYNAKGTTAL